MSGRSIFNRIVRKIKNIRVLSLDTSSHAGLYLELLSKPRYEKTDIELLEKPFEIADSLSFYYSYKEIFEDQIYKFNTDCKEPVILDCGSNYGTSIVYFKSLYPNSKITGIEADPKIFALLKKNISVRDYNNVNLLNNAVSNVEGTIPFYTEGADGGRTNPAGIFEADRRIEVPTVDLDELIQGEVDFLKMDIEGVETDVLSHSKKLNQVKQLFVEYHCFANQEQQLDKLLGVLRVSGFRYFVQTQFCSKCPLTDIQTQLGMDMQLNIFGVRV